MLLLSFLRFADLIWPKKQRKFRQISKISRSELEPDFPFLDLTEHCVVGLTEEELGKSWQQFFCFFINIFL